MAMNNLVLSIFPGIDLLGKAFEEEGFCVVRGPDLLWGGDIKDFHPPIRIFHGVIGGPPCKGDSLLAYLNGNPGVNLIGEFMRIVEEAGPDWWLMEAVTRYAAPYVLKLSPRWLGEKQSRKRYFHSNVDLERYIEVSLFEHGVYKRAVLAGHGGKEGTVYRRMATYSWGEMCELQGLPPDFELPSFTRQAAREAIGNGVPLSMGRALAKAIKQATEYT